MNLFLMKMIKKNQDFKKLLNETNFDSKYNLNLELSMG